jgi:hypothetical protein
MRGMLLLLAVVVLFPFTVSAATSTPVPSLTNDQYAALQSLNDLTPPDDYLTLDQALGNASILGTYSLVHGTSELIDGVTTNVADLPIYPATSTVTACSLVTGDSAGFGLSLDEDNGGIIGPSSAGSQTPWQQYVNACTLGGPACAVAYQQKTTISLGYWVGAGSQVSVPMLTFSGAPAGAPAPPAQLRSSFPIWGVNLFVDLSTKKPREVTSAVPTFPPASNGIWDKISGILTPQNIATAFAYGITTISQAQIELGYLRKIRVDVTVPALLQNVMKPTVKVCDFIPQNITNPTTIAQASATRVPTVLIPATPSAGSLTYYGMNSLWDKVGQGQVLGYRLHCGAVDRSYCVVKIVPPSFGSAMPTFAVGKMPASAESGIGGSLSACASAYSQCYYSWNTLNAKASEDIFIYCTVLSYNKTLGRVCPSNVFVTSAVVVGAPVPCPCVNFAATRTAGMPVTPSITLVPTRPTVFVVASATALPALATNTLLPTPAPSAPATTKTQAAIIYAAQTATAGARVLTTTAYSGNTTSTSVAKTATAGAYIDYAATATAGALYQNATSVIRTTQTVAAAATATQALYLAQTALVANTAVVAATAARATVVDINTAMMGRDPASVFGVSDQVSSSMSAFSAIAVLKNLFTAFTDGLMSSPCNGLPSSIDGLSLSGGWHFTGMAAAMCAIRQWLSTFTISVYLRALFAALIVLAMFQVVLRFFVARSANS